MRAVQAECCRGGVGLRSCGGDDDEPEDYECGEQWSEDATLHSGS
jgi:hypothetical protein